MTGTLARCAVLLALLALVGCKSSVNYAEDMEGTDPVAKGRALLYFAEQESDALEPETRELIRDTLRGDRNPMVRAQAAYVLGELPGQAEHVDWLLKAATDDSFHVRFDAIVALGKLGPQVASKRPQIVAVLKVALTEDPHPWVKMKAARALGSLGRVSPEEATALAVALDDDDPSVQLNAHRALLDMPGDGKPSGRDRTDWEEWLKSQVK